MLARSKEQATASKTRAREGRQLTPPLPLHLSLVSDQLLIAVVEEDC